MSDTVSSPSPGVLRKHKSAPPATQHGGCRVSDRSERKKRKRKRLREYERQKEKELMSLIMKRHCDNSDSDSSFRSSSSIGGFRNEHLTSKKRPRGEPGEIGKLRLLSRFGSEPALPLGQGSPVGHHRRPRKRLELSASRKICSVEEMPGWMNELVSQLPHFLPAASSVWQQSVEAHDGSASILGITVGRESMTKFVESSVWKALVNSPSENCLSLLATDADLIRGLLGSIEFKNGLLFSEIVQKFDVNRLLITPLGVPRKRTILHAIAISVEPDPFLSILLDCKKIKLSRVPVDSEGLTPMHLILVNGNCTVASINAMMIICKGVMTIADTVANALPIHYLFQRRDSSNALPLLHAILNRLSERDKTAVLGKAAFVESRTLLHVAASSPGSVALVKALVMAKSDLEMTDSSGYNSLHISCIYGHPDICDYLLSVTPRSLWTRGCAVQRATALHMAAAGGSPDHAECMRLLLSKVPACDLIASMPDSQGWPPLLYALHANATDTIQACLESDSTVIDPMWGEAPQLRLALRLAAQPLAAGRIKRLLSFLVGVPQFFHILNKFVSRDVSRLDGPLHFLLETDGGTKILNIDNKILYFRHLANLATRNAKAPPTITIGVSRSNLLRSPAVMTLGHHWYTKGQRVLVRFEDHGIIEEAYGYGPTREFFTIAGQEITSNVFAVTGNSRFTIPSNDHASKDLNVAAGRVVGLALLTGTSVDLSNVASVVWKYVILGEAEYEPELEMLESLDEDLYKNLLWLSRNDITEMEETIAVTTELTKREYITSVLREKLMPCNLESFRKGILDVVEEDWLRLFEPTELAVVVGGVESTLYVEEWRSHTVYTEGFTEKSNVIKWFWSLLEALPNSERRLVLLFATGFATLPAVGGFANLVGLSREPLPFTIMRVDCTRDMPLPTAATCFNLLRLPEYPSQAILNEKVLIAIRFGSQGFSFT